MSDNILDHNTDNITKEPSKIKSPTSLKQVTFEEVTNLIELYFSQQSRDQNKFYKDGDVHIVKDDFDIVSLMSNIHNMLESCIKDSLSSDSDKSAQVNEIFKGIESLIRLLKTLSCTDDVEYLFVVRLLSYCTSAYSKYHKTYVRYRKIQDQKGNT
jgi:hypothetical protein